MNLLKLEPFLSKSPRQFFKTQSIAPAVDLSCSAIHHARSFSSISTSVLCSMACDDKNGTLYPPTLNRGILSSTFHRSSSSAIWLQPQSCFSSPWTYGRVCPSINIFWAPPPLHAPHPRNSCQAISKWNLSEEENKDISRTKTSAGKGKFRKHSS